MILLLIVYLLIPQPLLHHDATGLYSTITGLYWCTDEYSCTHEQAHYIDFHNGMISHSEAYKQALIVRAGVDRELSDGKFSASLLHLLGWNMEEVYAWFYTENDGNVPDEFKQFYPAAPAFRAVPIWKGTIYVVYNR